MLAWETPPFDADLEFAGDIELTLEAKITAFDTSWIAVLYDAPPDGEPEAITAGWLRAAFSGVDEKRSVPGAPVPDCRTPDRRTGRPTGDLPDSAGPQRAAHCCGSSPASGDRVRRRDRQDPDRPWLHPRRGAGSKPEHDLQRVAALASAATSLGGDRNGLRRAGGSPFLDSPKGVGIRAGALSVLDLGGVGPSFRPRPRSPAHLPPYWACGGGPRRGSRHF